MPSQLSMRNVPDEYLQDPPAFLQVLNEFLWSIGLWVQIPLDAEEDAPFPVTDVQRIDHDHDGRVLSWMLVKCRSSGISDLLLNYCSDLSEELGQTVTVERVQETAGGSPHKMSRFMIQLDSDPSITAGAKDDRVGQAMTPHQRRFELAEGLPDLSCRSMEIVPPKSQCDRHGPAHDADPFWQVLTKAHARNGQEPQSVAVPKGLMIAPQLPLAPHPPEIPTSCPVAKTALLLQPTQEFVRSIEQSAMIQITRVLHELASNSAAAGWPVARSALLKFVDPVPFEIEALYVCASASPALRSKTIDLIVSLLQRDATVVEQTIPGDAMPSVGTHTDVTYGADSKLASAGHTNPVATNSILPSSPSNLQQVLEKCPGVSARSSEWTHYKIRPAILEKLNDVDRIGGCSFRSAIFKLVPLLGRKPSIPSQFTKLCECIEPPKFATLQDPFLLKIRNEGKTREVMYWMLRYLREFNVVELPVEMLEIPGSFSSMPNFSYKWYSGWKKGFLKFPHLLLPKDKRLDPDLDKRFSTLEWDAFATNGAMRNRLKDLDRSGGEEVKPVLFLLFRSFYKSKCLPQSVKKVTKRLSKLMSSLTTRYVLDSLEPTAERQRAALWILRYFQCLKIISIESDFEEWTGQSEVVWRPAALKKFSLTMDTIFGSDIDSTQPMPLRSSPMQLRSRMQLRSSVCHPEGVRDPDQSTDAEPMQLESNPMPLRSSVARVDGVRKSSQLTDAEPIDLTTSPMQLRIRVLGHVEGVREASQLIDAEPIDLTNSPMELRSTGRVKRTHESSQPTDAEPMKLRSSSQPTFAPPMQLRTRMKLRSRVAHANGICDSSQPIDVQNAGDLDPRDHEADLEQGRGGMERTDAPYRVT